MTQGEKLTPLSLAERPSATQEVGTQPPYDPQRQYGVDRRTIHSVPTMGSTTQTFDFRGKPTDADSD